VPLRTLEYFHESKPVAALSMTLSSAEPIELTIRSWSAATHAERRWTESCATPGVSVRHVISGLAPNTEYHLARNSGRKDSLRSDASGRLIINSTFSNSTQDFKLEP